MMIAAKDTMTLTFGSPSHQAGPATRCAEHLDGTGCTWDPATGTLIVVELPGGDRAGSPLTVALKQR